MFNIVTSAKFVFPMRTMAQKSRILSEKELHVVPFESLPLAIVSLISSFLTQCCYHLLLRTSRLFYAALSDDHRLIKMNFVYRSVLRNVFVGSRKLMHSKQFYFSQNIVHPRNVQWLQSFIRSLTHSRHQHNVYLYLFRSCRVIQTKLVLLSLAPYLTGIAFRHVEPSAHMLLNSRCFVRNLQSLSIRISCKFDRYLLDLPREVIFQSLKELVVVREHGAPNGQYSNSSCVLVKLLASAPYIRYLKLNVAFFWTSLYKMLETCKQLKYIEIFIEKNDAAWRGLNQHQELLYLLQVFFLLLYNKSMQCQLIEICVLSFLGRCQSISVSIRWKAGSCVFCV